MRRWINDTLGRNTGSTTAELVKDHLCQPNTSMILTFLASFNAAVQLSKVSATILGRTGRSPV